MKQSWILVGMMGAGKSAVGRELAGATGRHFLDTDQIIQNKLGRSISSIFATYGEAAFRDHETAVLKELSADHTVVSTGGGIVLREENWTHMRRLGSIIYLQATEETLRHNLGSSRKPRPLLATDNWQEKVTEILNLRLDLYRQADVIVDVDGLTIAQVAQAVMANVGS